MFIYALRLYSNEIIGVDFESVQSQIKAASINQTLFSKEAECTSSQNVISQKLVEIKFK